MPAQGEFSTHTCLCSDVTSIADWVFSMVTLLADMILHHRYLPAAWAGPSLVSAPQSAAAGLSSWSGAQIAAKHPNTAVLHVTLRQCENQRFINWERMYNIWIKELVNAFDRYSKLPDIKCPLSHTHTHTLNLYTHTTHTKPLPLHTHTHTQNTLDFQCT